MEWISRIAEHVTDPLCDIFQKTPMDRPLHLMTQASPSSLSCKPCKKSFGTQASYTSHLSSAKHTSAKPKGKTQGKPNEVESAVIEDVLADLALAEEIKHEDPEDTAFIYWESADVLWSHGYVRLTADCLSKIIAMQGNLSADQHHLVHSSYLALARISSSVDVDASLNLYFHFLDFQFGFTLRKDSIPDNLQRFGRRELENFIKFAETIQLAHQTLDLNWASLCEEVFRVFRDSQFAMSIFFGILWTRIHRELHDQKKFFESVYLISEACIANNYQWIATDILLHYALFPGLEAQMALMMICSSIIIDLEIFDLIRAKETCQILESRLSTMNILFQDVNYLVRAVDGFVTLNHDFFNAFSNHKHALIIEKGNCLFHKENTHDHQHISVDHLSGVFHGYVQ